MALPALLLVVLSQQVIQPPAPTDIVRTQLPTTTRPLMAPTALPAAAIVGVDQISKKGQGQLATTFRYNFRGSTSELLKRLMAELHDKDGWRSRQTGIDRFVVERLVKSGPLYSQVILIWPYKMVRDPKSRLGWKALPPAQSKGWIFVSYQEMKAPKQPPPIGKTGKS